MSALLMPGREAVATARGRHCGRCWRVVARQSGLALGVIGGIWLTGWLLGALIRTELVVRLLGTPPSLLGGSNIVQEAAVLLTFGTLGLVLGLVQVLRAGLALSRRRQSVAEERYGAGA